ncbi:hypothetical protein DXG01_004841 [Tephrocybe rancida]|nr:hypothetical protein DXG01_004841 [Tephrocybe rancida]
MAMGIQTEQVEAEAGTLEYELIEEGPASRVSRTYTSIHPHSAQWVIVKSATTSRRFGAEPHDIVKELRVLAKLDHVNIIEVWAHAEDEEGELLHIWEPYIPLSLSALLASPVFSPFSFSSEGTTEAQEKRQRAFPHIARSLIYQTLQALAYLHAQNRRIAHRDVKPANILLMEEGCVKLIDFGIAFQEGEGEGDMWPEKRPRMYFEVSTGPYRAPELLFGTRDYDASALDLWSAGATFAEYFTPLRFCGEDEEDEEEEEGGKDPKPLEPFIRPWNPTAGGVWERDTLFNGTRGELALAGSIFRVRGTPDSINWPAFEHLPTACGLEFAVFSRVPLAGLLPNLPPTRGLEAEGAGDGPLDLIERLLAYPAEERLSAERALGHAWFREGGGLLLPRGYPRGVEKDEERELLEEVEGRDLGQWVREMLGVSKRGTEG